MDCPDRPHGACDRRLGKTRGGKPTGWRQHEWRVDLMRVIEHHAVVYGGRAVGSEEAKGCHVGIREEGCVFQREGIGET